MKRTTRFQIRLSPEEHSAALERARVYGYTLANYTREMMVHGKAEPVLSINLLQWSRLSSALSNFNQMVRLCNTGLVPPNDELEDQISQVLKLLQEIRHDITTKQAERDAKL